MPGQYTYQKNERLKSRKLTEQLFVSGRSLSVYPLKIIFLQPAAPLDFPVKAGVSVPGRNFKKAVHRNRIKRLIREAYRTEKLPLYEAVKNSGRPLIFFMIYIDKAMPDYALIRRKMPLLLQRLIKEIHDVGA